jgi:hypothetical protein
MRHRMECGDRGEEKLKTKRKGRRWMKNMEALLTQI